MFRPIPKCERMKTMLETTPGVVTDDALLHFGIKDHSATAARVRQRWGLTVERVSRLGYRLRK